MSARLRERREYTSQPLVRRMEVGAWYLVGDSIHRVLCRLPNVFGIPAACGVRLVDHEGNTCYLIQRDLDHTHARRVSLEAALAYRDTMARHNGAPGQAVTPKSDVF